MSLKDKLDHPRLSTTRDRTNQSITFNTFSYRLSNNDIKNSLSDNGFIVEKNQIKLDKPIKTLGIHNLAIKLHPEVQATISLIVSRTESEAKSLLKGNEINIEDKVSSEEGSSLDFGESSLRIGSVSIQLLPPK